MIKKVTTATITNVVDIIENVVTNTAADYGSPVYYEHGHPTEIVNTLQEKTQNDSEKFQKFPLIALLEDFETDPAVGVFKTIAKLNILIITDTDKDYKASNRYTESFDKVLTPVYNLFMENLKKQRGVHVEHNNIPVNTIYHLYWGKKGLYGTDGNVFNDHIDAIEIKNMNLKIYR